MVLPGRRGSDGALLLRLIGSARPPVRLRLPTVKKLDPTSLAMQLHLEAPVISTKRSSLMNAKQLERASYLAAHAVLSADLSAPHLVTPGARRSYTVDAIANTIRSVFELHCSAFDESHDWQAPNFSELLRQGERFEGITPDLSSGKLQVVMQKLH